MTSRSSAGLLIVRRFPCAFNLLPRWRFEPGTLIAVKSRPIEDTHASEHYYRRRLEPTKCSLHLHSI